VVIEDQSGRIAIVGKIAPVLNFVILLASTNTVAIAPFYAVVAAQLDLSR